MGAKFFSYQMVFPTPRLPPPPICDVQHQKLPLFCMKALTIEHPFFVGDKMVKFEYFKALNFLRSARCCPRIDAKMSISYLECVSNDDCSNGFVCAPDNTCVGTTNHFPNLVLIF